MELIYQTILANRVNYIFLLINFSTCSFCGLLIILSNSYFGFSYFRDRFHIYLGIVLPVVGFTITLVIGSNIALSLGMLGALSIIRFRTPVRSSYELVIYFLLLTIGIATKVDTSLAIILTFFSIIVTILLKIIFEKFSFDNPKNIKKINEKTLTFTFELDDSELQKFTNENDKINISVRKENNINILSGSVTFDNVSDFKVFFEIYNKKFKNYEIYNS